MMNVRKPQFTLHRVFGRAEPARNGDGENYVFQDFEKSTFATLRDKFEENFARNVMIWLPFVVIWSFLLALGASHHAGNRLALDLTPHSAFAFLVQGLIIFRLRHVWLPVLAFSLAFLVDVAIPFSPQGPWIAHPDISAYDLSYFYLLNLAGGLLAGCLALIGRACLRTLAAPSMLDLLFVFWVTAVVIVVAQGQLALTVQFSEQLSDATREALGFSADFAEAASLRGIQGSVAAGIFVLTAVNPLRRGRNIQAVALIGLFPLLGLAHELGYSFNMTLDTVFICALLVLLMPTRHILAALTIGGPIYIAQTGAFVVEYNFGDPFHDSMRIFGTAGLFLMLISLNLRMYWEHRVTYLLGSIEKLNRVRDTAGIGLFSVNLRRNSYRLDSAAQRILASDHTGDLTEATAILTPDTSAEVLTNLRDLSLQGMRETRTITLPDGNTRVCTTHIWHDNTVAGDPIVFGLVEDVTDDHARTAKLQEAMTRLEQTQARQQQLFSIVSHELRTPASILSLLLDELDHSDDPARVRRQMRDSVDHLLSVINDMRQAVNPDKNLPVELASYVPADLAESVRNTLSLMAAEKRISITIDLGQGADLPRLSDVRRMKQVLLNLARNALIHSQGTQVRISYCVTTTETEHPVSRWRVEDDGVGISDDEAERLFNPFERGGTDPRKRAEGSGLGLFIVRSAVEMLGGTVAHFHSPLGGAGYAVEIPEDLAPDMPQTAPEPASRPLIGRRRVLLVEDNALIADVLRARLERQIGPVTVASNGREALEIFDSVAPDLVITDLFMPEMDGDLLTARLRALGHRVPIVGTSAATVGEETRRFETAGVDAVLQKPLDLDRLRALLERAST